MADNWLRHVAPDPGRCSKCCGTLPPDHPHACDECGPLFDPDEPSSMPPWTVHMEWKPFPDGAEEDDSPLRPVTVPPVAVAEERPTTVHVDVREVVDDRRTFTHEELAALPVIAPRPGERCLIDPWVRANALPTSGSSIEPGSLTLTVRRRPWWLRWWNR